MNCYKKIWLPLLGIIVLSCGCMSLKQPRNAIEYYTLEYAVPGEDGLEPLPYSIRVQRFSAAPTYNTHRIIYRDRSFARNSYTYHQWRSNPADMVSHFLRRDISESGLFKAGLPQNSSFSSSHVLEGTVDEFFESDKEETWEAVLTISVTLVAENEADITQKVLLQKTYRSVRPCEQRNPEALAAAMSRAMGEITPEIMKDVYERLKGGAEEP